MKLNILPPLPKVTGPAKNAGFSSPIGQWKVTTEGDEEGRTTTQLGTFYGHIAEIAFYLADKCGYSLRFYPETPELYETGVTDLRGKEVRATKRNVWISIGENHSIKNFRAWLNADESVIVSDRSPNATYYQSFYLTLK